jgi:phospholipase C
MFLERFVESKFNKAVREENISTWRRAISGDLTSVFRTYDPKDPALALLDRDKFVVSIEKAQFKEIPSNYKKLKAEQIEQVNLAPMHSRIVPRQEEGIRPACAVPYELYADGNLSEDGTHYELHLSAANHVHGAKSAGAPFNIYLRNIKDKGNAGGRMKAATYAVKSGDTLTQRIPMSNFADSGYSIEVVGPNGFYRSFTGRAASFPLELRVSFERQGTALTGNLQVQLHNKSTEPVGITIKDNSYGSEPATSKIEPGQEASVVLNLKQSHCWYDFTVKADGST